MKGERVYTFLFIAAVAIMSLLYGYQTELLQRPHGTHRWRQCDGMQIAANYYNVSMNFFAPRLNWCEGNDGKMVGEFPLLYYATACLYQVFGQHEFFMRLISIAVFFTGLFFLFKTISMLLGDKFYGLVLSLMLFSSALIIDYAFNFLPDVPALSLTFVGYYFFLKFFQQGEGKALWWAALFFALAGLLKITSLTGYAAIVAVLFCGLLFNRNDSRMKSWLQHNRKDLAAFILLPLIANALWIVFAKYYNAANHSTYFTTSIRPIWEATDGFIRDVFYRFHWQWLRIYMYRDFLHTLPVLFLLCYIIPNRKSRAVLLWLLFALLFSAAYFFLFFTQFFHHDYYMVCLMFLPIAILTVLLLRIKEWKEKLFTSVFTKAALLVLLMVMVYHGQRINHERESIAREDLQEYWNIEPQLVSLGIQKNDKVISIGDNSTGVSLYFMNRRGWTTALLPSPLPESKIEEWVSKGAKYMFVYKNSDYYLDSISTQRYTQLKISETDGIKIYKL